MPLIATRGAASAQGFGEFAQAAAPVYIEDVFSTYLYTGNGSTQTITNGIDLSGKGGLVWIKGRSGATGHRLTDTARGATKSLESNSDLGESTESTGLTAFSGTGFTIGADADYNTSTATYVSWAFRKQAKFFDVVTYTGNGSNRTISHNLGSVPGCIIVKRTDTSADWQVYHRSLANTEYIVLNSTAAKATGTTRWNSTTPTSTVFSLGTDSTVNANGGTYVAYLFANDAGGFGASGSDNVISCGSFTTTTSGNYRTELGYEPQFLLVKRSAGGVSNWWMLDTMRGFNVGGNDAYLESNSSNAEINSLDWGSPDATGFTLNSLSGSSTLIYIAIRRGPMKTPTSGTSVFTPTSLSGYSGADVTFPNAEKSRPENVDSVWFFKRDSDTGKNFQITDRLRGWQATVGPGVDSLTSPTLTTSSTSAESTSGNSVYTYNGSFSVNQSKFSASSSSSLFGSYVFKRAPGFFDMVCYTGTGVVRTISHNLTVVPELMIVKSRMDANSWRVYSAPTGNQNLLELNETGAAVAISTVWNNTSPTASVFTVGTNSAVNQSGRTFVAYLFATVPNVSKVGSYTGTGTTQQVNCGFTGGARFVLIKRTDSTGDWYVWDTARGIVSGNDPYMLLNSTAVEVTNTDYVDTFAAGFEISSTAPAAINANGGTFIFLAIA